MQARNGVQYDLFIDLSSSLLSAEDLKSHLAAFATLTRPPPSQRISISSKRAALLVCDDKAFAPPDGVPPLVHALSLAELDGRGLMVVRGTWLPRRVTLDSLSALAALDPNIGTVQPRFTCDGDVVSLPFVPGGPTFLIPRTVLGLLPEFAVLPEIDSPCTLVTPQAVPACLEDGSSATPLAQLQVALRRRGFRNLIANRILTEYPLAASTIYLRDQGSAGGSLSETEAWLSRLPMAKLERMLGESTHGQFKRLLLDCRGMTAAHNGSAHAILGYLQGIAALEPDDWKITVCVGRGAGEFHGLMSRFPQFHYEFERPRSKHLVVMHLTQPWSGEILRELHECAPLIAFNILDTIAWDAIYPAPAELDRVMRLAARFADGLLYLSDHSRRGFRFRFAPHEHMREAVTLLSTSPADLAIDQSSEDRVGRDILVIGNALDHKDVGRTADKLAQAFPFVPIVAFGSSQQSRRDNVTVVPSGRLSDVEMDDMFGNARVIVYPSFSEGFGIPVVHGLALGKPVVARELPLWDEIRHHTRARGLLRTFQSDAEMTDAVGMAVLDAPENSDRSNDGGDFIGWVDCGRLLRDFADSLVEAFSYQRWEERDLAFGGVA